MQAGSWVQNLAFPPASSTSQFIFGVPGQVKHFSFGPQMGQSLCEMATDQSAGHGLQRRVKYPGGSVAEFARIRGLGREHSPRILANSATTQTMSCTRPVMLHEMGHDDAVKMLVNMLAYKKVKNLATMDLTKLAEHVD